MYRMKNKHRKEKEMSDKKDNLKEELSELQEFIEACENAQAHRLGLDEATYDKYNEAIARQRELGKQLAAMNCNARGLYTSAKLMRKEPEIRADRCKIEAVVELDSNQFYDFRNHLFDNQEFIKAHRDSMYQDRDGIYHCLLVLGVGEPDGVLIESEGSLYARYSALLPNARMFMQTQIEAIADEIIRDGCTQSESGAWVISFDKISEYFNADVTPRNTLGEMLINELCMRDDVLDIRATDDCIKMKYYTDQINDQEDKNYMSLYSLMRSNLEDVHIVDVDEEHDLATIVELNQDTLTEDGKRDWSDVLGAKVERIFEGYYGLQIAVSGCAPERLEAFSKMLAGECSIEESERWINPSESGESFEMKFN